MPFKVCKRPISRYLGPPSEGPACLRDGPLGQPLNLSLSSSASPASRSAGQPLMYYQAPCIGDMGSQAAMHRDPNCDIGWARRVGLSRCANHTDRCLICFLALCHWLLRIHKVRRCSAIILRACAGSRERDVAWVSQDTLQATDRCTVQTQISAAQGSRVRCCATSPIEARKTANEAQVRSNQSSAMKLPSRTHATRYAWRRRRQPPNYRFVNPLAPLCLLG